MPPAASSHADSSWTTYLLEVKQSAEWWQLTRVKRERRHSSTLENRVFHRLQVPPSRVFIRQMAVLKGLYTAGWWLGQSVVASVAQRASSITPVTVRPAVEDSKAVSESSTMPCISTIISENDQRRSRKGGNVITRKSTKKISAFQQHFKHHRYTDE